MFNIGGQELLVILVLTLIILGPKRIPEVARLLGKAMQQFRDAANEVKRNLHLEDVDSVQREIRDTWRSSRQLNTASEPRDSGPGPATPSATKDPDTKGAAESPSDPDMTAPEPPPDENQEKDQD